MRIVRVLTDDDAVSPVIGIILMVAITVILATAIGTFALGLGGNTPDSPPKAQWDFEYPNSSYSGSGGHVVVIVHDGGETVDTNTGIQVGGKMVDESGSNMRYGGGGVSLPITSTNEIVVKEDGGASIEPGSDVLVIYAPNQPEIRAIIGEGEVP